MSKCTFCIDDVEAGREPACVAACPLRCLTLTTRESARDASDDAGDVLPPLPSPALTRPALGLRPHARTASARSSANTRVANREELPPRALDGEPSLIAFTLLAQTAAGLVWAAGVHRLVAPAHAPAVAHLSFQGAAVLLGVALAASLLHLGRPLRAWRALANPRTSWLSREILFTGAFALSLAPLLPAPDAPAALHALAAVAAAGMVFAMAAVYRLRTMPPWQPARTLFAFVATSLVLGAGVWSAIVPVSTRSSFAAAAALALLLALTLGAAWRRAAFYRPLEHDAGALR